MSYCVVNKEAVPEADPPFVVRMTHDPKLVLGQFWAQEGADKFAAACNANAALLAANQSTTTSGKPEPRIVVQDKNGLDIGFVTSKVGFDLFSQASTATIAVAAAPTQAPAPVDPQPAPKARTYGG